MTRHAFSIATGDPCLDGHFPDAPVVPGVVVLDRAIAAIAAGGHRVIGVTRCKFLRPLYPDETCVVAWAAPAGGGLRFACHGPRGVLVRGRLCLADDIAPASLRAAGKA